MQLLGLCQAEDVNYVDDHLHSQLSQLSVYTLMHQEIQSMLEKHAIEETTPREHGFLSTISQVPNKDGGQRPVINLKSLNKFVYTEHFKMESFLCLRVS